MRRAPLIISLAGRHRRRLATARVMAARGFPKAAIARALGLTHAEVTTALAAAAIGIVWSPRERQALQREMERAA